ncbi:MAG: sortase [Candidatus Woesebacteria bacterium]|nr:sortase [Candidatus Woesebacteria bacterium]
MESLQRSASRTSGKLFNWLTNRPTLLISLGLFIFFVGASHYYQIRILSFTKPVADAQTTRVGELPAQITIPSIGIDLPIDLGEIKDGVWQISYSNPTFLNTSARPGTGGNVVIYGHNKKVIFGNLPYLSIGQKIFIKTVDGKIYTYIAYQKDFVGSDRVDLVSPTNTEELTIYTCWGLFDTRRAVIKAKPI